MVVCDKWVAIKVFEVLFCIACVVCKRVTDDESVRLSLYLQKISREWSLLRNITWGSVGASFADAVYGGYVIITFGLLLGRIFREIPHGRRILEGVLLGFGALFFIILGSLELASLESIPDRLIDNAAVLGVLSLVTAVLFLIDLAGPRRKSTSKHSQTDAEKLGGNYPKLTLDLKKDTGNNTNSHTSKQQQFFPEKFKKVDKKADKDKGKNKKNHEKDAEAAKDFPMGNGGEMKMAEDKDDVDAFINSQKTGYHKFAEENTEEEVTFEPIAKTKYGSVRNGESKRGNMKENNSFQKSASVAHDRSEEEGKRDYPDETGFDPKKYDNEMKKNIAYLKMLDEKLESQKQYHKEDLARLNEQYMKEYEENIMRSMEYDKRGYPRMGMSPRSDYEKHKHWEKFEEENIPPFPVKEDYLPELQTPVFARIKENRSNKGYGIYDNLSLYNRKSPDEKTDSVRSKTKSKPPTLQQIAEYFGLQHKQTLPKSNKREASSQVYGDELPAVSFLLPMPAIKEQKENNLNYNGGPSSPTDPGYVQYTAQHWNDRLDRKSSTKTPRHSPTET